MLPVLDRDLSAHGVALFAALVHSLERGDAQRAASADAGLRALGFTVRTPRLRFTRAAPRGRSRKGTTHETPNQ